MSAAMRRIINTTYISLDAVIEQLETWHFEYVDDDASGLIWDQLAASDALLMGRKSYEGHAEAWPNRDDKFANRINGMQKYVASTTLTEPEWQNTTVIKGNLGEEVTRLKGEPGADILMWGFGPVAATLLQEGLLDELCLLVHPVFVGSEDPNDRLQAPKLSKFDLVDNRAFDSGVVVLTYQPR